MSSDKTTSRFFAFVSCGFAGAVVIGLGVWQLGVVQNSSQTTSDAGVIAAITSDSPVPAAMSGTNPSNTPLPVPTPNSSGATAKKPLIIRITVITQPPHQPSNPMISNVILYYHHALMSPLTGVTSRKILPAM